MQHKSFEKMSCPIARSLERVGEWWSMLIMRDALHGMTRFDEFQNNLGIAPNMLTRRLNSLVDAGLLERRRYSERPPRHDYVPTMRGRDLLPVITDRFLAAYLPEAREGEPAPRALEYAFARTLTEALDLLRDVVSESPDGSGAALYVHDLDVGITADMRQLH